MSRRLFSIFLIVAVLAIRGTGIQGQTVGKSLVINYDKRVYGAANQNWSVAVNSLGLVYVGNDRGLLEFDGSNWRLYPMPEHTIIRAVAVEGDSIVYVGSYEEFGYWKSNPYGILEYHSLSDSLLAWGVPHNDEIWRIIPHKGKVYFQSFSNIFIYDRKKISIIKPESAVVLLMKARERLFIHMVGRGLFEIIDDKLSFVTGSDVFAGDEIKVMLPLPGDHFLVGASRQGMYVYDGKAFTPWNSPHSSLIRQSGVNNGLYTDEMLVIGTIANGLFILDNNGNLREHLFTDNFLQNNTVLALETDRKGNIWAALDRGIDFINLHTRLDIYVDPLSKMGPVYTAVTDGTSLLVGTNHGLYRYRYVPGRGYTRPVILESIHGQVWNLRNIDGNIICGHNEGTSVIRGDNAITISEINGGFCMKPIPGTDYWLQSTYSSLVLFSRGNNGFSAMKTVNGFLEPVTNFEFDHLENIWASHATKGIFRIRLNQALDSVTYSGYYGKNKGFPAEREVNVASVENRIVFPTGQGIYTWDDLNDSIVLFTQLNNQAGEFSNARQIIKVRDHYYWFIMGHEVAYFRISEEGLTRIFQYDLSMQGLNLVSHNSNIVYLDDSAHLVCLDNGFALFNESAATVEAEPSGMMIRSVSATSSSGKAKYYKIVPGKKAIHIPYSHHTIHITFGSNQGYRYPQYRHMLQGLEDNWSGWHGSSGIEYTRLPAGEYVFMAGTKNIHGQHVTGIEFAFTVNPPWYRSIPAIIIYALLLFVMIGLIRWMFLRRLTMHKLKYEDEERKRREQEALKTEQELIQLKNEKLQAEIRHKTKQLADFTANIVRKNEHLIRIREKLDNLQRVISIPEYAHNLNRIITIIDNELSSEDDWNSFRIYFDQTHQDFIKRLKSAYTDLTQSDLKLCAFLRLNLSSKEIAPLLNISTRGVEIRRYRLRKRLNMKTEENLVEFLLGF